jgi:hypothetical protein
MNSTTAVNILGINRQRDNDLRPMIMALNSHSWLNTPEETERLQAARWALRNWVDYQVECKRRRRGYSQ